MRLLSLLTFFLISPTIGVAQSCDVPRETVQKIRDLVCGQLAREPEYRFTGANCAAKSIYARAADTAAQVLVMRSCGEIELSEQVRSANLKALGMLATLSVCVGERLNPRQILSDAEERLQRTRGVPTCTNARRNSIAVRRNWFVQQIEIANDRKTLAAVHEGFRINVDMRGNIRGVGN